jgi:WYL domain
MGFFNGSIDQKQHINLSSQAWGKIDDDIHNFYMENGKYNLSGFLNTVFENFYEDALASVSYRMDQYNEMLEEVFDDTLFKKYDKQTKHDFTNKMATVYKNQLLDQIKAYPKGEGKKYRISNGNMTILEDCIEDIYYEGTLGNYLKGVFEEYASKSYDDRERIFFKDKVKTIRYAIEKKLKLKITLKERSDYNGNKLPERKFYVSPYSLVVDKTATFNYLIGYSEEQLPDGTSGDERIVSIRLSRIKTIKSLSSKSGKIPSQKVKVLEQELEEKGPQFLTGDSIKVVLRLTDKGIENYNRQINLRPSYKEMIDKNTYLFECTELQILYYFFKFGRDVTILSPENLKQKFKYRYQSALNNYIDEESIVE